MALAPGTHQLGPGNGTLRVNTYREGMAQKVGHDLVIDVRNWRATVEVTPGGEPGSIMLEADPTSCLVLEGRRGIKPLTDKDRSDIRSTIDQKVLLGKPITFVSGAVEHRDSQLEARGELTLAGTTRPAAFALTLDDDGRAHGALVVTQSEWGIKPYRGLMGALKVRDAVEIVFDVRLPTS